MKIWVMTLILAVGFALLPSCREKSLTNSRVVVTAVGIDAGEEADCRLSIQAIETLKTSGSLTEQAENATKVYDIEAPSVAGALQSFVTRTGRSSYILHNRAVVIGLEQAKRRPLSALLDYFIRNHEGRSTVDMAVCRGEAAELLAVPSAGYTIPAEHLSVLLQQAGRQGFAVPTDLLDVERSTSGMYDMVMPIVRVDKTGEEPAMVMDGTAVFRRGEYAGELDEAATRGLLFGRGDLQTCTYPLSLPGTAEEPERLTVEVVSSKTKVHIRPEGEAAVIRLTITCSATVLEEYRAAGLESSDLKAVAGALQEAILQDVRSALDKTIGDWGCDVYGFSRMVKKKAPELVRGREGEWPARLRDCRFEVEVKADAAKAGGVAGGGIMQK